MYVSTRKAAPLFSASPTVQIRSDGESSYRDPTREAREAAQRWKPVLRALPHALGYQQLGLVGAFKARAAEGAPPRLSAMARDVVGALSPRIPRPARAARGDRWGAPRPR